MMCRDEVASPETKIGDEDRIEAMMNGIAIPSSTEVQQEVCS